MSYRDLRNFTEMMRTLGYSRLISMENFRIPNFTLVAEIIIWLIKRFDPDHDLPIEFKTEEDRVQLIRSVAQFMATKANIKLNTKRLYQADGYAVIELLKMTTLLYEALKSQNSIEDNESSIQIDQITEKINDLKFSRELASEITNTGAKLYEFLGQEVILREQRNQCINTQLELSDIETSLEQAINESKEKVDNIKSLIDNIATSEISLDKKIEKRQIELDRNTKRLQTLKKVRPAFLEEYETLEIELKRLHQEYVMKFRCLSYLNHQIDELEHQEQERIEEKQAITRRLAESIRSDDSLKIFDEDEEGDTVPPITTPQVPATNQSSNIQTIQNTANRLRTATGSAAKVISGRRRIYGSMNPSDSSSDDDDFLLDDDDDEDDEEDDDNDEENGTREDKKQLDENSDDDF